MSIAIRVQCLSPWLITKNIFLIFCIVALNSRALLVSNGSITCQLKIHYTNTKKCKLWISPTCLRKIAFQCSCFPFLLHRPCQNKEEINWTHSQMWGRRTLKQSSPYVSYVSMMLSFSHVSGQTVACLGNDVLAVTKPFHFAQSPSSYSWHDR